jgi:hypothetical protein
VGTGLSLIQKSIDIIIADTSGTTAKKIDGLRDSEAQRV